MREYLMYIGGLTAKTRTSLEPESIVVNAVQVAGSGGLCVVFVFWIHSIAALTGFVPRWLEKHIVYCHHLAHQAAVYPKTLAFPSILHGTCTVRS